VAVDYGLFLVARHRNQVDAGMPVVESAGQANARSGSAIVVAGTTVIIAILGLYVAGVPFISALGVSAAVVVAVTMLAALTLVPAFLGLARGSVKAMRRKSAGAVNHEHSAFARWGRRVSKRPWPWATGALLLLLVITIPLFSIQFGQLDAGTDPTSDTDRRAYDLVSQGFGAGANGPLTVVMSVPAGQSSTLRPACRKPWPELWAWRR
jgi:RND superfamily putative drug exporter